MRIDSAQPPLPVEVRERTRPAGRAERQEVVQAEAARTGTNREDELSVVASNARPVLQNSLNIHLEDGRPIYWQIIDSETGEVVRQVPPEEVVRASRRIAEFLEAQEAKTKHVVDLEG